MTFLSIEMQITADMDAVFMQHQRSKQDGGGKQIIQDATAIFP